jgi:hypothetical protein
MTRAAVALLVWPFAIVVAVLGVWMVANAFDEELSPQAKATLPAGEPSTGPITEENGYLWMASLAAPVDADPIAFARTRLEAVRAGACIDGRDLKDRSVVTAAAEPS